jgi:hypothetical protein
MPISSMRQAASTRPEALMEMPVGQAGLGDATLVTDSISAETEEEVRIRVGAVESAY